MLVRMETGVATLEVSAPAPAAALQSRFPKNPVFLLSHQWYSMSLIKCHSSSTYLLGSKHSINVHLILDLLFGSISFLFLGCSHVLHDQIFFDWRVTHTPINFSNWMLLNLLLLFFMDHLVGILTCFVLNCFISVLSSRQTGLRKARFYPFLWTACKLRFANQPLSLMKQVKQKQYCL